MRKEHEKDSLKTKVEVYQEMQTPHKKKLDAQYELICLLKEMLRTDSTDVDDDNVQSY